MAAKGKLKTRAARAREEMRQTGRLVLRAPALVRFAECVMRLLLGAVLAGAEIFGGYAPFGLGMVACSGSGLDGFCALLGACLGIEAGLGRRRSFANAPRPVDLDVLLMEGIVSSDAELILPHPRMGERGFVLIPLRELYPDGCPLGFDFRREMAAASAEGVSYYKGTGWWNPPA